MKQQTVNTILIAGLAAGAAYLYFRRNVYSGSHTVGNTAGGGVQKSPILGATTRWWDSWTNGVDDATPYAGMSEIELLADQYRNYGYGK